MNPITRVRAWIGRGDGLNRITAAYVSAVCFLLPLVYRDGYFDITQAKALCYGVLTILFLAAGCVAGLCRRLTQEASFFLDEAGVKLSLRLETPSLLVPGDPTLLQKLLLSLLSNAVKAAPGGEVVLSLTSRHDRAILTLGDSGDHLKGRDLEALFPPAQPDHRIPDPQDGAGMGLAIVRHIVALHGGTLLLEHRGGGLFAVISLPTGPLDPRLTVQSPRAEDTGGLSPVLVELSDVLPLSRFQMDEE